MALQIAPAIALLAKEGAEIAGTAIAASLINKFRRKKPKKKMSKLKPKDLKNLSPKDIDAQSGFLPWPRQWSGLKSD